MNILYYDCFSGISGDMHLGAMLDIGVDSKHLKDELSKLGITGYTIEISKANRNGIEGTKVSVSIDSEDQASRDLKDIKTIIESSDLSSKTKQRSLAMFHKLAEAEAKIHGKSPYEIHFHEIGSIDSIIDIVGAAICIEYLNIDKIICSPIELGGGFVNCEHGTLPVPTPATSELLRHAPVKIGKVPFEVTTPTGAVILSANVDEFGSEFEFSIEKIGYGIGDRILDIPNVLRICVGKQNSIVSCSEITIMLECNIDDMNPELYEHIIDELLNSGAKDVFLTPIIMKKTRPATKLSVLCDETHVDTLSTLLLKETTTLGVRKHEVERVTLEREITTIETQYGKVRIKHALANGKILKSKPEYEDCLRIAKENGLSLLSVYQHINQCLHKMKD